MSTTRFGEDLPGPSSTLSLLIVQFDPSGPDSYNLAMNYRLISLRLAMTLPAGLELVA